MAHRGRGIRAPTPSFNLARLAISGRPGRIVMRRSLRALRLYHPERTKLQRKVQVRNQCQHSTGPELLHHFTVGGPIKDTRLTTLPAYPDAP